MDRGIGGALLVNKLILIICLLLFTQFIKKNPGCMELRVGLGIYDEGFNPKGFAEVPSSIKLKKLGSLMEKYFSPTAGLKVC